MIITCFNCNKIFDINANLIPDNGRLVQCSSCNHKWFFKKEIDISLNEVSKNIVSMETDTLITKIEKSQTDEKINNALNIRPYEKNENKGAETIIDKTFINEITKKIEDKKIETFVSSNKEKKNRFKLLNLIIVFLISFVAFIILIETFKTPLGKIIPNIEVILFNLFETITDIKLFFKDLR